MYDNDFNNPIICDWRYASQTWKHEQRKNEEWPHTELQYFTPLQADSCME